MLSLPLPGYAIPMGEGILLRSLGLSSARCPQHDTVPQPCKDIGEGWEGATLTDNPPPHRPSTWHVLIWDFWLKYTAVMCSHIATSLGPALGGTQAPHWSGELPWGPGLPPCPPAMGFSSAWICCEASHKPQLSSRPVLGFAAVGPQRGGSFGCIFSAFQILHHVTQWTTL